MKKILTITVLAILFSTTFVPFSYAQLIQTKTTSNHVTTTTTQQLEKNGNIDTKSITTHEKYAIIVCGGIYDKLQNTFHHTAQHLYNTLLGLGYTDNTIYYLDKYTFAQGVDEYCCIFTVALAITDWLASRSTSQSDVLIYMLDHGDILFGLFYSGVIPFDGTMLNFWLRKVDYHICTVIVDSCFAGWFVKPLSDENRIIITGTDQWNLGYGYLEGEMAFSESFITDLAAGKSYGKAWIYADHKIVDSGGKASKKQNPQIDDNGDGKSHGEKGVKDTLPLGGDGNLALSTYP